MSDMDAKVDEHERTLAALRDAQAQVEHLEAGWRMLPADTLSPQEVLNIAAWALGEPRKTYTGDMHPDKSLFDLVHERDELQRKGELLCLQNGNLLVGNHDLRALARRLLAALEQNGKHPDSCPKGVGIGLYKPPTDARCDCGIDAAIAAARSALGEVEDE